MPPSQHRHVAVIAQHQCTSCPMWMVPSAPPPPSPPTPPSPHSPLRGPFLCQDCAEDVPDDALQDLPCETLAHKACAHMFFATMRCHATRQPISFLVYVCPVCKDNNNTADGNMTLCRRAE